MKKDERIVSFSAEELRAKLARGGDRSDWDRVRAMTDADVEAAIASDPDEAGMIVDWSSATVAMPQPKKTMTIRLDRDVLEFFQKTGRGYQTKINAVLRSYMTQSKG